MEIESYGREFESSLVDELFLYVLITILIITKTCGVIPQKTIS